MAYKAMVLPKLHRRRSFWFNVRFAIGSGQAASSYLPCHLLFFSQKNEQKSNVKQSKPVATSETSRSKKKRKRVEDESSNSNSAPPEQSALPTVLPKDMTPLDYFAPYYQFVVAREEANPREHESEDVCFCCKDGGDVIECDWRGLAGIFDRCPKVYHQGVLLYSIWVWCYRMYW